MSSSPPSIARRARRSRRSGCIIPSLPPPADPQAPCAEGAETARFDASDVAPSDEADDDAAQGRSSDPSPLPLRRIVSLWFPLALSFELMMLEGPLLQAAVGRLPDAQRNLAAWGLALSLSLLIESPVIMLLATSIALCRSRGDYAALRRFVLGLCAGCTVITAALAFTPLFEVVTRTVMRQPEAIATAARPVLAIMLLWSAAIGYRRFYQGILVRARQTARVSWGTAVRLTVVVATGIALVSQGTTAGAQVAGIAIMAGVIAEAVLTRAFVVGAVAALPSAGAGTTVLTQRDILRFHAPLAATTLLTLLASPLTAAAVAWLPHAEDTLAAWPVAFITMLVIRGGGLALQEIAVACAPDARARAPLARFTWIVGGVTTLVAALLASTPALDVYLARLMRVPEAIQGDVGRGIALCCLLPLFTALSSEMRGRLMADGETPAVYAGMGVCLITQASLLCVAVLLAASGIEAAAGATMGAAVAECAYLRWRLHRRSLTGAGGRGSSGAPHPASADRPPSRPGTQ